MKTKEITLDPEKSGKEVHKALLEPIRTLARILRKKLKGAYGSCKIQGWIYLKEIQEIDWYEFRFPGTCYIASTDAKRTIGILINFGWWDKDEGGSKSSLQIAMFDERGREGKPELVSIKTLDNFEFINGIKDLLKGNKKFDELPWEKWRAK